MKLVTVFQAYTPDDPGTELTLQIGDVIEIINEEEVNWWVGRLNGKEGYFPVDYVRESDPAASARERQEEEDRIRAERERRERLEFETATKIQTWWRMVVVKRYYLYCRRCIILIQAIQRGRIQRKKFKPIWDSRFLSKMKKPTEAPLKHTTRTRGGAGRRPPTRRKGATGAPQIAYKTSTEDDAPVAEGEKGEEGTVPPKEKVHKTMGGPAVLTFDPTRVQLKKAAPAESPRPEKTSSPGGFDISKVQLKKTEKPPPKEVEKEEPKGPAFAQIKLKKAQRKSLAPPALAPSATPRGVTKNPNPALPSRAPAAAGGRGGGGGGPGLPFRVGASPPFPSLPARDGGAPSLPSRDAAAPPSPTPPLPVRDGSAPSLPGRDEPRKAGPPPMMILPQSSPRNQAGVPNLPPVLPTLPPRDGPATPGPPIAPCALPPLPARDEPSPSLSAPLPVLPPRDGPGRNQTVQPDIAGMWGLQTDPSKKGRPHSMMETQDPTEQRRSRAGTELPSVSAGGPPPPLPGAGGQPPPPIQGGGPPKIPAGVPFADASLIHGGAISNRPAPQGGGKHWEQKRQKTQGILARLFSSRHDPPQQSSSSGNVSMVDTSPAPSSSSSSSPSVVVSSSGGGHNAPPPSETPSMYGGVSASLVSRRGSRDGDVPMPGADHAVDQELYGVAKTCSTCVKKFSMMNMKKQCRRCKKAFCSKCSKKAKPLPKQGYLKPVRVCDRCFLEE